MKSKLLLACLGLSIALLGSTARAGTKGCDADVTGGTDQGAHPKHSEPLKAAIVACTKIATPAKRLDCYDALTGHSD
jgi:hypothetical protein